ncbi:MAG TPA: sialate O-acetylesterase [Clostridiales bacterium]|nr:sialate O-acetylesterase [Clostridiales bacterium]
MIKLADIFQSGMTLQRQKPIRFWGESDSAEEIKIKIDGHLIACEDIPKGSFEFFLPAQEAAENVKLEIGSVVLERVDIGEVWIAGGQSNMEFFLRYDVEGDAVIANADDDHVRYYDVAKYAFEGEREEGFKDDSKWDKWLTLQPAHASEFSAVGTYFAMELRKELRVPVAIVGCNWGGTSASAWIEEEYLAADQELSSYLTDYEAQETKLDLEQYYRINKIIRQGKEMPESKKIMDYLMRNSINSMEMIQELVSASGQTTSSPEQDKLYAENYAAVGPNSENRPSGLYKMMLSRISGYTSKGVIWYQGENDAAKAGLYTKLFSKMIECWRRDWKDDLPFLFVQLPPFGQWMNSTGDQFIIVREQQEAVSKTVKDSYMISISDVGDEYDIHPKRKKPVGHRLALCARNKVYGEDILSDAPEAKSIKKKGRVVIVSFLHGEGLHMEGNSLNAIRISVDDTEVNNIGLRIEGDQLIITSEQFEQAKQVTVEFAKTGYYQVNLYNKADIPAKPFLMQWKEQ